MFAGMSITKYGMLKKLYYRQKEARGISWIWGQMGMGEMDNKKEKVVKDVEALVVEANYVKWSEQQKK